MIGDGLKLSGEAAMARPRSQRDFFAFLFLPFAFPFPLLLAAWMLIGIGCAALLAALSVVMLPYEHALTGLDVAGLSHSHGAVLVDFVVHNRISFGGALVGCGLLYHWLITRPLRRGEGWAWYTLALSGGVGVLSFAGYFYQGYVDPIHAAGSGVLAVGMAWGLWQSRELAGRSLALPRLSWRAMDATRLLLTVWAAGNLLGGLLILLVGVFPVFVAEDLAFLRATLESFDSGPPLLLSFVAHDRVGFGGALVAGGIAQLGVVWGSGERLPTVLKRLAGVWLIGAVTVIGVHPLVGYNSLTHLLPFLVKDSAFLLGLGVWYTFLTPDTEGQFLRLR